MINTLLISILTIFSLSSDTTLFKDKGRIEKDSLLKLYANIQGKPSSTKVVDEINNIAYKIYTNDYLKSFELAKKALSLSKEIEYKNGEAEALHIIGISFTYSENYAIANQYQDQAIAVAKSINEKELIARAYNAKGLAQYRLNNFIKAHQYFNVALNQIQSIKKQHPFESAILHNKAALLDKEGNTKASLAFYDLAIKLNKANNNKLWLGQDYYEKAIALRNLSRYNEAIELSKQALLLADDVDDARLKVNTLNFLANIYINFDRYNDAEELLIKAESLSSKAKLTITRLAVLKTQSRLAEKKQNFKQAFSIEKVYNQLYDSIYSVDRFKQLDEFRSYFETEQKEKENSDLLKSNLSQEIKIQNKNYFIFAVFLLLSLSIYLIYLLYKNTKRINRSNAGLIKQNEEINQQKLKLEELNQLKNRFFSIISHDLRGPLLSLKGMFSLFHQSAFNEKELSVFMNELENNFKNTSSLVDNLLVWAKNQMKGEVLVKKRINICNIVDENINLLKIQHQKKNLQFLNHLQFCYAYADEETIGVVLRNLLSNACKFTPDKGQITISSKKDENQLTVCVQDTGIGMTKDEVKQVLNHQFYSTEGTQQEKGTGLGLMLSDEFIKKNNGEFWIESEKGVGSSFYFSLPLKK